MSLFGTDDAPDTVDAALQDVNVAAPSNSKFTALERVVAQMSGLPASRVVAVTISKAGNTRVRAGQSGRARSAQLLVCVVTVAGEVPATRRVSARLVQEAQFSAVLIVVADGSGAWQADWAVVSDADVELAEALGRAAGHVDTVTVQVSDQATPLPPESRADMVGAAARVPLILEERTRRMVRTSVASHPAVMLVGPPGTGKSQLVGEIFDEAAENPAAYGMTTAPGRLAVTLDESWTTRELVGGDTVDDRGRLRFSPGFVLQAIAQDRWLVLDEANRADLDRIFGGLLTWLAGQTVTIGRVSGHPDAGAVRLGWNDGPHSVVVGAEQLVADEPSGESVDYLAGSEWRMLGTYNALDAQRVFRFGLALGRRFAHVPIPAPDADAFVAAVASRLNAVPEVHRPEVEAALVRLYVAHLEVGGATLGPAMFLGMPGYVANGLEAAPGTPVVELLAESYLTGVGMWLARLDEEQLDVLQQSVGEDGPLGREQWDWVRNQLNALQ